MLTEGQRMVRETARRVAQGAIAPGAADRDHGAQFPTDAIERLGALGFMGMLVPEKLGGSGSDHVSYALAIMEIAAADGACSTIVSVHNSLVCATLLTYATEDQKAQYLRPLACGQQLGAFCLSEPEAGSDAGAIKTMAHRAGNRYVLNGSKQFITSGKAADVAIVFALTDPPAGKKGISAFIVPTCTPGYRVARVEKTMGQRASDHCHLVFEDCEILPEQRLGEEGEGLHIALSGLEGGRLGVASQSIGMARSAYEAALRYAKERKTFGLPIIEHQGVGFQLADMATALHAAELLALRAAMLRDEGQPSLKEVSIAKLFASEAAERICRTAIQIHGGYGYLNDFPVERIYRDVRVCQIYEGSSEIQRLVISRQLAGEEGFNGVQ